MNQTIAHKMYDDHVKESLMSGKPVELSLKDFMTNKEKVKKVVIKKSKIEKELWSKWKENQKEYQKESGLLRLFLFNSYIIQMMVNADSIEEVKEIYSVAKNITYNNPA